MTKQQRIELLTILFIWVFLMALFPWFMDWALWQVWESGL